MRVLVVGGAGYVGAVTARRLQQRGDEVVVYDDLSMGHRESVRGELVEGDVRDRERLGRVLREGNFDAVLHFAAQALVADSVLRPIRTWDINVGGAIALIAAMRDEGPRRLVFSSTCAVYGDPMRIPVDEDHPVAPTSPYGASKAAVESLFADAAKEGLRITSLRYFNAAGAWPEEGLGEDHEPETHLIPNALRAALGGAPLLVMGEDWPTPDGTAIRDYVHVLDLADAHLAALERDIVGVFNLGTGRGASVREVITAIERATGVRVPTIAGPRRVGDPASVFASNVKAREFLGWVPSRDLDDIVESALAWERRERG